VVDNLVESAGPVVLSVEEQEERARKKVEFAADLEILER
jgi:hypothetical protein